jgi:hypothetical protein
MAYLGTRDPGTLTAEAPIVDLADLTPEPITAPVMEVLHGMIEVDERVLAPLMPPALCMTLPPMVAFVFWRCLDSSVGPFKLAQARINTRLLVRSRGLLLGSYFEGSPEAAAALRRHWGFACEPGEIAIRTYHDEVVGTVEARGRTILQLSGKSPATMEVRDLKEMANLNPIRLRTPEGLQSRMIQVESEFRASHASRSILPKLERFEGDAWSAPGVRQEYPVVATHYACEFRLPPPRYMVDPALPTDQRSVPIG